MSETTEAVPVLDHVDEYLKLGADYECSDVHLAVNAQPGTPVSHLPKFVPATGQRIRVWVCYWDKEGKFQVSDARRWVKHNKTNLRWLDKRTRWLSGLLAFFCGVASMEA